MARRPLCAALTRMPAGNPVDYAWNEWEVQSYFNWADNAELARLSLLTGRANIALAIAICEWIEARFVPHGLDKRLSQYIDAGWAALIDRDYSEWIELEFPAWAGPVREPQLIAMGIINEAYYESDDNPEMAWRACYALNLARYVLPETADFEEWFAVIRTRLEASHSWQAEGGRKDDIFATEMDQGGPVAREVFDPDHAYDPSDARKLLSALVARLDRNNPYLHLPPGR